MGQYKSEFINRVIERGYMHQCTDLCTLDTLANGGIVTAYIGFDCTAPSLHAGSLVSIMLLRLFQQAGHKPIVLMGGGTTKVGARVSATQPRPRKTPFRPFLPPRKQIISETTTSKLANTAGVPNPDSAKAWWTFRSTGIKSS